MQFIRTLCVVAVLGALTYGAYVTLTASPPVEPPLDAVNWDSPPHIELPASPTPAAALPAAKSLPAPKFTSSEMAGSAKLATPTDAVAGTPLKPTITGVRADTNATQEPPLSYPSTNMAPGPFDTAGSTPLSAATPAPPVASSNSAGPMLPGVSLPPASESPPPVTPAGGAPPPPTPNLPTSDVSLTSSLPPADAPASKVPFDQIQTLATTMPAEALEQLSAFFDDPALSPDESSRVTQMLDYLAGTVVYSRDHLLEPAHVVQPGDRLDQIAVQYNVPWELLAKINGIADPGNLVPGTQLKVVRGPFAALVDKSRRQLSVFLVSGMYAGSFSVGFGQDRPPYDGQYAVVEKALNRAYPAPDGSAGIDPHNPLRWLDLGNGYAIHTVSDAVGLTSDHARGCIRLGPIEAADVYDILSVGSPVIVRP